MLNHSDDSPAPVRTVACAGGRNVGAVAVGKSCRPPPWRSMRPGQQRVQRGDGVARMTPAAQLVHAASDQLLLETIPTGLRGCIWLVSAQAGSDVAGRSEERRVGKECSSIARP